MKKIFFTLFVVFTSFSFLKAENIQVDTLWNKAIDAYTIGEYQQALDSFEKLEQSGYKSSALFYNMANSYFKIGGYLGKSILYYERSLRLDPSFEDAQANLALAKDFTQDKIDQVPEFIMITGVKGFMKSLSPDGWAYISIVLFFIVVGVLLVFRYTGSSLIKKISFIFAILLLLMSIGSFVFSIDLKSQVESDDYAIVINPVTSVRSSPGDAGKSLFILHEGAKVEILERLGSWTRVEIADGKQGWMQSNHFEII